MTLWTPDGEHPVRPAEPEPVADDEQLSEDDRAAAEALAAEMADVRRQLLEVPAAMVVANHAMGLYELAAIHLGADEPNLGEAKIAIDAFGSLIDSVGDRLGPDTGTMRDALAQIRLAFVQIKAANEPADAGQGASGTDEPDDPASSGA